MSFKVIVVDDSAFMRAELTRILESDYELRVVASAKNGKVALEKIARYKPDVVTLDINMPVMDGLTCLREIMRDYPLPVVMISMYTDEGAEQTLDALNSGAVDFIQKPSGSISLDISTQAFLIQQKVKSAAANKGRISWLNKAEPEFSYPSLNRSEIYSAQTELTGPPTPQSVSIVGIGASTGGPRTLSGILSQLPRGLNISVIIGQHMPGKFTPSFADRLNSLCLLNVKEAEHDEMIESGTIYIAPGDVHTEVNRNRWGDLVFRLSDAPVDCLYSPSIEKLFQSCSATLGNEWLGVMLTGMGNDGSEALADLFRSGGHTIVEHETSCVVYGMPKRVVEIGGAEFILPVDQIPQKIVEITQGGISSMSS